MTTEIRVLDGEDDLIAAANVFRTAMVGFPPLSDLPPGQITTLLEPGRTIGAFVGGQLVGTADAVTSRLTLPGGAIVSHAAVTHIGVLPSFTRKGIATDWCVISCVTSRRGVRSSPRCEPRRRRSTSGTATAWRVHLKPWRFRQPGRRCVPASGPAVRCDFWTPPSMGFLPGIYDENRPSRPGTIDRPAVWWQGVRLRYRIILGGLVCRGARRTGLRVGLRPLPPDRHREVVRQRPAHHRGRGFLRADQRGYLGCCVFCSGWILLTAWCSGCCRSTTRCPGCLLDRRALRVTAVHDETWLRIVDAGKALAARQYAGDGAVTIAVNDPLLPDNSSHFRHHGRRRRSHEAARPTTRGNRRAGRCAARRRHLAQPRRRRAGPRRRSRGACRGRRLFAVADAPYAGIFF